MKTNSRYRKVIELIILGLGIIFLFLIPMYYWFAEMLVYIGFFAFIFDLIINFSLKKRSIKVLGVTIAILTLINLLRHIDFYMLLIENRLIIELQYIDFYLREIIWLFPSIAMIYFSVKPLINKNKWNFDEYIRKLEFKLVFIFFLTAIILDFPIFGIHGDFAGGLHGHGLWDAYYHFH